jgi:hypothetical protein
MVLGASWGVCGGGLLAESSKVKKEASQYFPTSRF